MTSKSEFSAAVHPNLERLIREWAKEMHRTQHEVVFEAPLAQSDDIVAVVSERVVSHSPVWLFLTSTEIGNVSFVASPSVPTALSSAFNRKRMISMVDPRDGGGLTFDVSDEGGIVPVLQIAGWGACTSLVGDLLEAIPGAKPLV